MNINGKESLWIDRGWRTGDIDKDSGLSGMKLLANSQMSSSQGNYTDCGTDYAEVDPRNMSTFYNCRKSPDNPTPYATTMLINSMPQEICANPTHSHSEHEICAGGSSGTSSLHSDGKYCMHSKQHYTPGERQRTIGNDDCFNKILLFQSSANKLDRFPPSTSTMSTTLTRSRAVSKRSFCNWSCRQLQKIIIKLPQRLRNVFKTTKVRNF